MNGQEIGFRELGDTTVEVYEHEFRRLNSDLLPYARRLWQVLTPHTVLAGAMLAIEQSYWTDHRIIPAAYNNPFSLSAGWRNGGHVWHQFPSVIEGAEAFIELITGPVFADLYTVPEFVHRYAPSSDGNNEARIVRRIFEYRQAYKNLQGADIPGPSVPGETPGNAPLDFSWPIPLPPITPRIITNKPVGMGYDLLGGRDVWGEVLHRMQGTLWGTDSHFRNPLVAALTDYGIDAISGEMLQWLDPYGNWTPHASGPVSQPYGDGLAFVNKFAGMYGYSAVNRFLSSLEISGYFRQPGTSVTADTPLSDIAISRIAQWLAHFAQKQNIPWHEFPIRPDWGFSNIYWHQEFTLGTGKLCPGDVVMAATPEIIARTREVLRLAQTGSGTVEPEPKPEEPTIAYPIGLNKELATLLFGAFTADDGRIYRFDEKGPVSLAWLTEGSKDGEFGKLVNVLRVENKPYFVFDDGLVLYQPNRSGAYRALGVGEPTPASVNDPKR